MQQALRRYSLVLVGLVVERALRTADRTIMTVPVIKFWSLWRHRLAPRSEPYHRRGADLPLSAGWSSS